MNDIDLYIHSISEDLIEKSEDNEEDENEDENENKEQNINS